MGTEVSDFRRAGAHDTPGGDEAGARALRHQASPAPSVPAVSVHIGARQEEATRTAGGPPEGARPDVKAGPNLVVRGWEVSC